MWDNIAIYLLGQNSKSQKTNKMISWSHIDSFSYTILIVKYIQLYYISIVILANSIIRYQLQKQGDVKYEGWFGFTFLTFSLFKTHCSNTQFIRFILFSGSQARAPEIFIRLITPITFEKVKEIRQLFDFCFIIAWR